MKALFTLFFLLSSIITVGQITSSVIDSNSTAGQIVHRFATGNSGTQSLAEQVSKKKIQGYRLCDKNISAIDSLDQLLNNDQVQTLLDSSDRTLRFIGFILFSRHNNIKETVVLKFLEIIKEKYYPMITDGNCNHAVNVSDLGSFCYELIVKPNLLFKPNFKLSKGEKALLKKRLEKYKYEGANS